MCFKWYLFKNSVKFYITLLDFSFQREPLFLHGYQSFACGIACPDGLSRMSKLRATCGNLRAISHNPIYIRAAHAIRILDIECPWRTGATGTYETLPRTTMSRFFSSLPPSCLSPSSRHAARVLLSFSQDHHGG